MCSTVARDGDGDPAVPSHGQNAGRLPASTGAASAIVHPTSDHEVDDVQSIEQPLEQPLTEFARSEAIQKRHGGGRDEPNCGRWSSCGFKLLKHLTAELLANFSSGISGRATDVYGTAVSL
jgi:hypothetical protein